MNVLTQEKVYLLNKLTVRTYMDDNHLAFFSSGARAEDLQDIVKLPQFPVEQDEVYAVVTIDSVQQLEQNVSCNKNIPDSTESMCMCPNCHKVQTTVTQPNCLSPVPMAELH